MRVKVSPLPNDPATPFTLLDIKHPTTANILLRLMITSENKLRAMYNNVVDVYQGAQLQDDNTVFTTVVVVCQYGSISTGTDRNGETAVYGPATNTMVDNTGIEYNVFVAGDYSEVSPTAGGTFDSLTFQGNSRSPCNFFIRECFQIIIMSFEFTFAF